MYKYDPTTLWPNDDLLVARVKNYMKTEARIASYLQKDMSLEKSLYQISLNDWKNLAKGASVRNTVRRINSVF